MAAARRVRDDGPGLTLIAQKLRGMSRNGVAVGVLGETTNREDGTLSNADIGTVHEFGSLDGRIPERSFIRSTIDDHAKEYAELVTRATQAVAFDGADIRQALGIVGEKVKADIRKTFNDSGAPAGSWPAIADSTVEARAKKHPSMPPTDKPLLDTAQLKQSIAWDVRSGGGEK